MNLTPKQIQALRIALAEVAGWIFDNADDDMPCAIHPTLGHLTFLPNWPVDLNAVHELEMGLTDEKLIRYGYFLSDVMTWKWPTRSSSTFATALQRCIALLMTLAPEKWLEIQNLKD